MTCACGREADFDTAEHSSEDGPQFTTIVVGGELCFECQTFVCNHCIGRAMIADPSYDPSLCVPCDARYPRDVAV